MDGLAVVAAAVIAGFGGIWLDRTFQERDRRRDLYLEVLDYLDNIGVLIKERIVAGDGISNVTLNEVERQVNSMNTKVDLLASKDVRQTLKAYREAWPRVLEALPGEEPSEDRRDFSDELGRALKALDPERTALVQAMRVDLKQRPWGRRRV